MITFGTCLLLACAVRWSLTRLRFTITIVFGEQ